MTRWLPLAAACLLFAGGCIVGDDLTTLTVHPDGSAELVVYRSNLHSTRSGEAGEAELAQFKANFDSRLGGEFDGLQAAEARLLQTAWIRDTAPLANVLRAAFANADQWTGYYSSDEIKTTWERQGRSRRVSIRVSSDDEPGDADATATPEAQRKQRANGLSEFRVAVTGGKIVSARGFLIADDGQSALLDLSEFIAVLQGPDAEHEFHLEWEVER